MRRLLAHALGCTIAASTTVLVAVVALGAVVSAQSASVPSSLIYLTSSTGVTAVNPTTGTASFSAPRGVASGDWSQLISSQPTRKRTLLRRVDAMTGNIIGETNLAGALDTRVVSFGGDLVALSPDPGGVYGKQPGRTETRLIVLNTNSQQVRTYTVHGNIEPEAFSTDGGSLFVIQYFPPLLPDRYEVRLLSLSTGTLRDVPSPDGGNRGSMPGIARTHVMAPDGSRLYTLYTSEEGGKRYSFVHVLDLDEEWAHCVDLPLDLGDAPEAMAIGVSPNGSTVYVADGAAGKLAEVSTTSLTVIRTARLPHRDASARPAVSTTLDRVYLAMGDRVLALDSRTLEAEFTAVLTQNARSILATPSDLNLLYVAQRRSVVGLDGDTGQPVSSFPAAKPKLGGAGYPLPSGDTVKCAC
jgi:outer membrane protein assembly factor BamB